MSKVISFGGGVNSTALIVQCYRSGLKFDHIIFADTRGEKPKTYEHIEKMQGWLADRKLPPVTIVKEANGLEDDCITRETLPGKAFGFGSCSERFKVRPQRRWVKQQGITDAMWLVGIHAGEAHRARRVLNQRADVRFPLIEWGWGQAECVNAIAEAGLEVPVKSACFFCPAMRKPEVIQLSKESPELFKRAVDMEDAAKASGCLNVIKGLGRRWSWSALVKADNAQLRLFDDPPIDICDSCVDW